MSRSEFNKIIDSDEFAGKVIRLCVVFEDRLGFILTAYFTRSNDRWLEFHELVIEKMSLYQKIELLEKINCGKDTKSRNNFIASLKSLRKIRNGLAHSYSVHSMDDLDKLYSDSRIRSLVLDYPKSISNEKRNMEARTTKLFKMARKKS